MKDGTRPMSLKTFRLKVSDKLRGKDTDTRNTRASRRSSTEVATPARPKLGHRAQIPDMKVRLDLKLGHMPAAVKQRQTCKCCSTKEYIHRSKMMCSICKVALCLSKSRNCFITYHNVNQA